MQQKHIPAEALLDLCRRLDTFASRSPKCHLLMQETALRYGVSEVTLYRILRLQVHPWSLWRSDRGEPRALPKATLEPYCEIIAATKVHTSNKQGCHLSTAESIRLLERYGIETPDGHV